MASFGKRFYEALRANLNELLDRAREQQGQAPTRDEDPRGSDEERAVAQAYVNLELAPGVGLAEVKKQYRRLMARYHPDRHHQDAAKSEVANRLAAELTRAYDTITAYWARRGAKG